MLLYYTSRARTILYYTYFITDNESYSKRERPKHTISPTKQKHFSRTNFATRRHNFYNKTGQESGNENTTQTIETNIRHRP